MYDVVIVGGGLSGLMSGIILARFNHNVLLLEKKSFPFQRVCGEYISNEVKPFLIHSGCFPADPGPSEINRFQLTSITGKSVVLKLDLGGFGISRYRLDESLAMKAVQEGVVLQSQTSVNEIAFNEDHFKLSVSNGESYEAKVVIGAFGKRSILDKTLDRKFMKQRSPYVGVKYHVKTKMAEDLIALHNFKGGYCGISKIEDDKFNLCYLASRDVLKKTGNIPDMEKNVIMNNPWLKEIWNNSEFLFDQPEVINEISFAKKEPVFNHILMSGDASGMIAPLCGNGMAMAIHAAKICSALTNDFLKRRINRDKLESDYRKNWHQLFARRLWIGRYIQKLFGSGWGSDFAVHLLQKSGFAADLIIKNTHGKPF